MGDGTRVRFWYDLWFGDCSLKVDFSKLYNINYDKESSVAKVMQLSLGCFLDWPQIGSWSHWLILWT